MGEYKKSFVLSMRNQNNPFFNSKPTNFLCIESKQNEITLNVILKDIISIDLVITYLQTLNKSSSYQFIAISWYFNYILYSKLIFKYHSSIF